MLQESNWNYEIKADWPRLPVILFIRLETLQSMLLKLFEQKIFLSNCRKQLVTPVNLTRKKNQFNPSQFDKLFNFQNWERAPKAKNCLLQNRSHFGHSALLQVKLAKVIALDRKMSHLSETVNLSENVQTTGKKPRQQNSVMLKLENDQFFCTLLITGLEFK